MTQHDTDEARHQVDPDERQRPGDDESGVPPEERPGVPGAEGGSSTDATDTLPGAPAEGDSELGDTDQHSSA